MKALDKTIAAALAVDVPALPELDLPPVEGADAAPGDPVAADSTSNVVDMQKKKKPRFGAPVWLGLAASFAIVAVFGTKFLDRSTNGPDLALELVAHLDHEPQALRASTIPVSERNLAKVVSTGRATLDSNVGLVTYARSCEINGKTVPHLVIQGKFGPVTVLLLPDEQVKSAVPVNGNGISGVILPVGDGSIAIIGDREEDLEEMERQVIDSVSWTI